MVLRTFGGVLRTVFGGVLGTLFFCSKNEPSQRTSDVGRDTHMRKEDPGQPTTTDRERGREGEREGERESDTHTPSHTLSHTEAEKHGEQQTRTNKER